jgi:rhodanese-related sulfurtransferase
VDKKLVVSILVGLFLVGCGGSDSSATSAISTNTTTIQSSNSSQLSSQSSTTTTVATMTNIEPNQIASYTSKGVKLIDVRLDSEWRTTGVIKDSLLITSHSYTGFVVSDFVSKLTELNITKNTPIAIICNSGNRSLDVVSELNKLGFLYLYNVQGGIVKYISSNLPVVSY